MAACPGTCEGNAALAGKDAERDNPTLNAKALNSWFFSSLMLTLVSWNERRTAQNHNDVIEFYTAEQ